jgi:hypothetical protein
VVITGGRATVFVRDSEGIRVFLREVLQLPSVDRGAGWLIFALPSVERLPTPVAPHAASCF